MQEMEACQNIAHLPWIPTGANTVAHCKNRKEDNRLGSQETVILDCGPASSRESIDMASSQNDAPQPGRDVRSTVLSPEQQAALNATKVSPHVPAMMTSTSHATGRRQSFELRTVLTFRSTQKCSR